MKTFLWIPCLLLSLMPTISRADTAAESLTKVKALIDAGNYREAADLGKKALAAKDATGELLLYTGSALGSLDASAEFEEVIEATVKAHPQTWDVLLYAGKAYYEIEHYGTVIDGVFRRGEDRDQGRYVQSGRKDRVRSLQLLLQALEATNGQTEAGARDQILYSLIETLGQDDYNENAWALLALTDLSQLPDFDDQTGLDEPAGGYPVDADGKPIFFTAGSSWKASQNDGQRLLWLMEERAKISKSLRYDIQNERAELAKSWFGIQTLGSLPFNLDQDAAKAKQDGIAAVHTLKDNETAAKLATGPKRFALPEAWAFLDLYRSLAEDTDAPVHIRINAWSEIADELKDRRQFERAALALDKALALEKDENQITSLKQQIAQIRGNWAQLERQETQPSGKEAKLTLLFRNATQITFTARKVDVPKLLADTEAYLRSSPKNQDWQKANVTAIGRRLLEQEGSKYLGKVAATWEQKLEPRGDHWDKRQEIATPLQEGGAWFIEGTVGNGNTTRALLWLEEMVIVQTRQAGAGHYFLADATTGAPIEGATVKMFGYRTDWKQGTVFNRESRLVYSFKDQQLTSNEQGEIIFKATNTQQYQWLIAATSKDGKRAHLGFENLYFYSGNDQFNAQNRTYTITDRPVYRPGQEVKWKSWVRQVSYDSKANTNPYAGAKLRVAINNPRGEKVSEKDYTADDSGAVDDVLVLDADAGLGTYSMAIFDGRTPKNQWTLGAHSFRVEEYKKPEFEVKIDAPTTPVALGDKFEAKVKADYYFGGPVKQGKIKYKVRRSAHTERWFPVGRWDWLFGSGYGWRANYYSWYPGSDNWCFCIPRYPWVRWNSDPPELVADGESPLNADGTFTIKVDTALAKELHGNEDHRYEIEAEVTDESRRTIFGKGRVLAARKPFEVYVSLNRGYYQAGEAGEVRVNARTLDGRSVKASGQIKLLRVTYGQDSKPNEELVASFDIKTGEEEAKQAVKWEQAGQYRVSVTLKDEGGHEIEGISFVTVRGEGFADGKDYRFDDLELITQKDEYAPGDEVELTINTNRQASTVALFLRAQNSVYPAPVWIKLEGKSTTYKFKLTEADQPNVFIEAYTVSDARVHTVTRQIVVPPSKRIATVELMPDSQTYLPRQGAKVKVRVKDQDGKPFVGQVVLTAYDKALEYISGGSNQEDIRNFFWSWKRSHYPQISNSLKALEAGLLKEGEPGMGTLGAFGDSVSDNEGAPGGFGGGGRVRGGAMFDGRLMRSMAKSAPMPMAAPAPVSDVAGADAFAAGGAVAAAPPPPPVHAMEFNESSSGGSPEPMIRSNLADSAVWVADFTTDTNGEGELNYDMPDNLTTWKLRSWVMGPQTQVGEADVEVITRKNLMVRLQAPRFFVEKDEVVLSANVHNELDEAQLVKTVIEFEGGVLELIQKDEATRAGVSIPAHGEKRFDWRVKVVAEGEAKVRIKALAQKDSDAMEMTFPAYVHGMLKTDSWSLALKPTETAGTIKLKVPAERKPEQSRLEVRYSPTLAMALVDALPYLADYPYGCTEQTLNRFLPTVITLGVLKDLGLNLKDIRDKRTNLNAQEIGDPEKRAKRWQGKDGKGNLKEPVFDEDEVLKMAKTGLKRLEAMRNSDGGWGWFPGGRESSPYITALVVQGLKDRGTIEAAATMLSPALQFLTRYEEGELSRLKLPVKDQHHKSAPDNLDAMVHGALVAHRLGNKEMRGHLYEKRLGLSRYNIGLLGLACHAVGEKERRDVCLRNLQQFLKKDDENQTAYLELPAGGSWWYWYEDQIETQAVFLRLLVAANPKDDTAPRIAKYLLNNRRHGTWWNSTKDTAAVIEALAAFMKASGEAKPNLKVDVVIDGQVKKSVEIDSKNLFTFDGTFVLEGEDLATGEHTVELRKTGESPLYVNAYLTVFSKEDMIPAAGLEVKGRRAFYKLIEEKPDQQVAGSRGQVVTQKGLKYRREKLENDAMLKSGDLIEVELTVESKNDYEYVLIEDMKPAGFEPIEVQSGWSYEGLSSYKEFRDERVAFFAERLPRGTHNLSYRVKAEIPGRFSALPTKVEAMYAPELKGNSEEWKVRISD